MKCSVCGRNLRNPESQEVGYGPVCYKRLFGARPRHGIKGKSTLPITGQPADYNIPGQISIDEYLQTLKG